MDFKASRELTFGLELELQIVSSESHALYPGAAQLHDLLTQTTQANSFALEATQATIEVNSSVHHHAADMLDEVTKLVQQIRTHATSLGCDIRGGGTNMTQFWNERVMSNSQRAKDLNDRFGFLPKRFSTYGMHVHVGMPSGDDAVRVGNVLQGMVPLFIAMSAASPFLQLTDTGFAASRPLEPLVYPTGGPMPRFESWGDFEAGIQELYDTGLAKSMKDVYWDVRPKPEFGTIEVRVFDTPLNVEKAVSLAAFVRGVAGLALNGSIRLQADRQSELHQKVSRFLACRDGMTAELFDPYQGQRITASAWLKEISDVVVRQNSFPSDLPFLEALVRRLMSEEDHLIMRESWRRIGQTMRGESAEADTLAAFSQEMRRRLLSVGQA